MGGRRFLRDGSGLEASFPMMASTTATEEGLGSTPAGSGQGSTGAQGRARRLPLANGQVATPALSSSSYSRVDWLLDLARFEV